MFGDDPIWIVVRILSILLMVFLFVLAVVLTIRVAVYYASDESSPKECINGLLYVKKDGYNYLYGLGPNDADSQCSDKEGK